MSPVRYVVTDDGTDHLVELAGQPLGLAPRTITVDGVEHQVQAQVLPSGAVSLLVDGRSYDVEMEQPAGADGLNPAVMVRVRGDTFALEVMDQRRKALLAATRRDGPASGPAVLLSPMPGKVVKILKAVGDEVSAGQGVIVVEAMKMENELTAPTTGTISEVKVKEGQPVEGGAALVVIG